MICSISNEYVCMCNSLIAYAIVSFHMQINSHASCAHIMHAIQFIVSGFITLHLQFNLIMIISKAWSYRKCLQRAFTVCETCIHIEALSAAVCSDLRVFRGRSLIRLPQNTSSSADAHIDIMHVNTLHCICNQLIAESSNELHMHHN
jgi:hypothetical protein